MHKLCLSAFKSALHDTLSGGGVDYSFADVVSKATSECETRFEAGGKEAWIEKDDWSWEDELGLLREEIANVAEVFRKDETKKTVNHRVAKLQETYLGTRGRRFEQGYARYVGQGFRCI